MLDNPKVEISAMNKKGQWIRVTGEVAILYFKKGTATISSFTAEPETFSLYI